MSDFATFIQEHSERVKRFRESLTPETDRGCAITSAAFVDEEIKRLLIARLVDEPDLVDGAFGRNGPLSSFSARIDFAFLLGMLSKSGWRDLHLLRRIRNEFAHFPDPLSFNDESIRSRCFEFTYTGRETQASARQHFTSAVCGMLAQIHARLFRAERPTIPKDLSESQIETVRATVQETRKELKQSFEDIAEEIIRISKEDGSAA
jgi:DNA-binding MltR family transcriptional regulator